MKLTQTLLFGSVGKSHPALSLIQQRSIQNGAHPGSSTFPVLATTGMVSATPTPTEVDSVISQAPRGLGVDEWVGEMIEAEIEELERLRLEVEGIVETEMPEEEVDGGSADIDIDEKDGEHAGEGDDEPEEPQEPEEPKHPKHPKDDKHKHKHGKDKGEKKHKHKGDKHDHEHKHKHGKGDKHDHEHKHKHGKHHGGPPHGPPPHGPPPHGPPPHGPPPHGPPPHGPPHGGPHGGPPRHLPHGPPPPGGPPRHREGEHHDKAPRPPHRHHETDGPDDEDQMDDYFRVEDQEDENAVYNEDEDEDVQQPSEEPYDGERGPASQGPHRHHGHHHMDGMTGSGRGHHGPEHSRGFFHQSVHTRARSYVFPSRAHPYHFPLGATAQTFCLAHPIQAVRGHGPGHHLHPRSHFDDEDRDHAILLRQARWSRREERLDEAYGRPRGWQTWTGSQARYGKGRTGR